ncbi:Os01g0160850 [Oryza sativa Japonica Group]|uniref:Os01g0160850 protein n=1 Tax=Oryza sativa subsp. japonica TaxID=39947 RepID=A0A0P0UYK0_ORYSJ|nr:Os01g0160850 [Oryza sativa Japonica Group]
MELRASLTDHPVYHGDVAGANQSCYSAARRRSLPSAWYVFDGMRLCGCTALVRANCTYRPVGLVTSSNFANPACVLAPILIIDLEAGEMGTKQSSFSM